MLQMVKLKLLDSTGNSLESIDLGTMVTLKIGLNHVPWKKFPVCVGRRWK